MLSYLITNVTLNMDRVALKYMIGNVAVTQYYVVSPDREDDGAADCAHQHDRDFLSDQEGAYAAQKGIRHGGAGRQRCQSRVLLFCQIATPIFVRLLYPDLYEAVRGLVTVVNLTQVLGMFSAFLFILVLTFTDEKWQLILQSGHLILMTVLVLCLTGQYGIMGFSCAVLAANVVRVFAVTALGFAKLCKNKKIEEV